MLPFVLQSAELRPTTRQVVIMATTMALGLNAADAAAALHTTINSLHPTSQAVCAAPENDMRASSCSGKTSHVRLLQFCAKSQADLF